MSQAPDVLRIAVAQSNPTVGDITGNLAKAREARADAARHGADLVLFTELFISGYPPEDLVMKPAFLAACEKAVREFAEDTADGGPGVVIGVPLARGALRHNSVMVLDGGTVTAEHGVGKVKREYAAYRFSPLHFAAMKGIKRAFDPSGILAPGNIWHEE